MTHLRLFSNNELDLGVDVGAAQDLLAGKLDATARITAYSHSMLNTILKPVSSPPEAWYFTLDRNLQLGKNNAQTWVSSLAPQISAQVPQSIINFSDTFTAAADSILQILRKGPLSVSDKLKVLRLIDRVLQKIDEEQSTIKSVGGRLEDLGREFQADYTRLTQGQSGAAEAVRLAQAEQLRIENKIREIQTSLESARQKVTAAGIGTGLGIFIAVAAIAMAVVTGGVGLAVVGAIAVVGVGAAATFAGIYTSEISGLISELAAEQSRLSDQKKQVAALTSISNTAQGLVDLNKDAKTAMTAVQTMWSTLGERVQAVHKNIDDGKSTLAEEDFTTAKRSWNRLAEFAEKMQDIGSGVSTEVLPEPRVRHLFAVAA